ncbi:MAG: glycosyltransferase family 9 protein [Anaerolineae bacterium]|jgi:lipopolysaccharide heptosyltransferase II|nr:glycosyltransferase family 9 protein [Anaerolineae bacterium]
MLGRNLLCVRLDNFGDVIMTTPAFHALKQSDPTIRLTLLTSLIGAEIAQFIPDIDQVIAFEVPWVKSDAYQGASAQVQALIERLKAEAFDCAIIFTVFSQNPLPAAMLCYLADIPIRVAYCRENPYGLLTHWQPDQEPFVPIQHEVLRQLALIESVGVDYIDPKLQLRIDPSLRASSLHKMQTLGLDLHQAWLILHPGVSESKRRYPTAKYLEAGRQLRTLGWQIVVTGSTSEIDLCGQVATGVNGISLAGQLSLGELIGLVASAPLLIANNTGIVHIAAAMNTPVIVLYAHTNPQHTPWNVPHRVLYFDVPPELQSRNVLLRHTYHQYVSQPVIDATPIDILNAVKELTYEYTAQHP